MFIFIQLPVTSIILLRFILNTSEQFILNHNIADQSLVLNEFAKHPPLALFLVTGQKYTSGAAMESAILSQQVE